MHVFRVPLLGNHLMPKLNLVRQLFSQGEQHGGKEVALPRKLFFVRALPTMPFKKIICWLTCSQGKFE